jgi:hypothetical protein
MASILDTKLLFLLAYTIEEYIAHKCIQQQKSINFN